MAVALDSDAVIGFLDSGDAHHASSVAAVRQALAVEPLVVSAVTVAEVLTGALIGHHDEALVRGFFREVISAVVPVDAMVAEAAARLRATQPLRMPDALVLSTALVVPDVQTLITGDRRMLAAAGDQLEVRLLS